VSPAAVNAAARATSRDAAARADRVVDALGRGAASAAAAPGRVFRALRFLFFPLFLLLAVVGFWLWVLAAALGAVRLAVGTVATLLMWLAGGAPRAPGVTLGQALRGGTRRAWARRSVWYYEAARPLARGWLAVRGTTVRFWRWHPVMKLAALAATVLFVGLPAIYLVPRPHYVQILDNNSFSNPGGAEGRDVHYLVHAADLFRPGKYREYENERAPYLGKIDPQGLKARLVPGRYYRLWVVGIRWYWLPTLFPNIIRATEVDAQGHTLGAPSHLIARPESVPATAVVK